MKNIEIKRQIWLSQQEDLSAKRQNLMIFLSYFEKKGTTINTLIGFTVIGIISAFYFITKSQIVFFLLFVFPISYLGWLVNRWIGIMASFVITLVLFWTDTTSGYLYAYPHIPLLNSIVVFSTFISITLLVSKLRSKLDYEKELARIDNLTGAVNSRLFFELLQMEIDRLRRYKHTFTLAFFDLDNFKAINDKYGHITGNQVLCSLVSYAKNHLRKVDVISRLGGDEFAVLLPETGTDGAKVSISRLKIGILEEMQQNKWPITLSIGVVTCETAQCDPGELLRIADNLMYASKNDKNKEIKYSTLIIQDN